jgi:hypothetical protein
MANISATPAAGRMDLRRGDADFHYEDRLDSVDPRQFSELKHRRHHRFDLDFQEMAAEAFFESARRSFRGGTDALNERLAHGLPAKDFLSDSAFFIRILKLGPLQSQSIR